MRKRELSRLCARPDRAKYHKMHPYGSLFVIECPVCLRALWIDEPNPLGIPLQVELAYHHAITHLMRHTKQQLEAACLIQTMVLS